MATKQIIGVPPSGLSLGVGLTLGKGLVISSGLSGDYGLGGKGFTGIAFAGSGSLKVTTIQHGLSQATFAGAGSLTK